MPNYRIHRMKDSPRQQFRFAPHVSGVAHVKPKDYQDSGHVAAANEYEAWRLLRDSERALEIGDMLESESGELRICKYVGFEQAEWIVPEVKSGLESVPPASGPGEAEAACGNS
jgi:hypothetical protein